MPRSKASKAERFIESLTSDNVELSVLRAAIAGTRSAMTITTAEGDQPIIFCNQAFIELTGYDRDEIIGRNCRFLQGDETDARDVERISKAVKNGDHIQIMLRNYRKDGTPFWNDLIMSPIFDKTGTITHFIGLQLDVSDRVEYENARARARLLQQKAELLEQEKAQLKQLNRIKDDFLSIASHQLRTPATGVKQYLAMVLDGYAGDVNDDQRKLLETAYSSNERQLKIVDDMLRTANVEAGRVALNKHNNDIARLLSLIVDEQQPLFAECKQMLKLRLSKPIVNYRFDADKMRMAIENIVDNALKYSREGVTTHVSLRAPKDEIVITIKDEGVGISEADIPKLFVKFSRITNPLSNQIGGSGLGLFWARSVIELHGGTIDVDSTMGKGTTFTIRLPR